MPDVHADRTALLALLTDIHVAAIASMNAEVRSALEWAAARLQAVALASSPAPVEPEWKPEVMHDLKCWPEFYVEVAEGRKNFEIRVNDRDFHANDGVDLREWDPNTSTYTGRSLVRRIGYVTKFGQAADTVVFSLLPTPAPTGTTSRCATCRCRRLAWS